MFHSMGEDNQRKLVAFFRQNSNTNTPEFALYRKERIKAYQDLFDKRFKEGKDKERRIFTNSDFWNEFAAENCETLFTNQDYINKLSQLSNKNKGLKKVLYNILDFVRKVWRKLTGTTYKNSRATEIAGITVKQLADAEKIYADALMVKSETVTQSSKDGVAYSISKQIDTWLQGKMKSSDYFDFGSTPTVLEKLGAKKLPLVMNQDTPLCCKSDSKCVW